jgi:hypothetical protein
MIKSEEVRLGNRIGIPGAASADLHIVVDLNTLGRIEQFPDYYSPIGLTNEWLFAIGFKKYDDHVEWYTIVETATGPLTIDYNLEEGSLFIGDQPDQGVLNVHNVHEIVKSNKYVQIQWYGLRSRSNRGNL